MNPDYIEEKGTRDQRAFFTQDSGVQSSADERAKMLPAELRPGELVSPQRNRHRWLAALRSSIRSRSTSQNLSDERRRLCAGSNWGVSSSSVIGRCNVLQCLLGFCSPPLDFDLRKPIRFGRPAPINDCPPEFFCSNLVRATIEQRL